MNYRHNASFGKIYIGSMMNKIDFLLYNIRSFGSSWQRTHRLECAYPQKEKIFSASFSFDCSYRPSRRIWHKYSAFQVWKLCNMKLVMIKLNEYRWINHLRLGGLTSLFLLIDSSSCSRSARWKSKCSCLSSIKLGGSSAPHTEHW